MMHCLHPSSWWLFTQLVHYMVGQLITDKLVYVSASKHIGVSEDSPGSKKSEQGLLSIPVLLEAGKIYNLLFLQCPVRLLQDLLFNERTRGNKKLDMS